MWGTTITKTHELLRSFESAIKYTGMFVRGDGAISLDGREMFKINICCVDRDSN
jgi:hypothetical protein